MQLDLEPVACNGTRATHVNSPCRREPRNLGLRCRGFKTIPRVGTISGRWYALRDCADRRSSPLVLLDGPGRPSELGPGFFEKASEHDDGVGQAGPGLLDWLISVQDDLEDPESAGVPGIEAFDHPPAGVIDLDIGALR